MSKRFQQVANLFTRNERGQMLLMVAGSMVVVIGFAALAVDLGFLTHSRRGAQNDADAMALAAVRELTVDDQTEAERQENAEDIAMDWALKNDVDEDEVVDIIFGTTCSGDAIVDTVTVRLRRTQQMFFANIFGIASGDLNVCATARTGMAQGGPGLMPFGLLYDDPAIASDPPLCYFDDPDITDSQAHADFWDEECTIKIPKPNDTWTPGNSGPLRLDEGGGTWDPGCNPGSSGASEYTENIRDGSECGYAPDDEVTTKTGSMNNITCDNIDTRLGGNTDTFEDVFTDTDTPPDGVYDSVDESSPRYVLIPVVIVPPGSAGSSTDVIIERFVTAYLVGCTTSGAGANKQARVTLIPVQSDIYVTGIDFVEAGDADYESDWPLYTIKLVE